MGDVEHSYNYIELLCVLYFGTSGHNTDLKLLASCFNFEKVAIIQPFFDDADQSFGFRSYYNMSMAAGYAIHFYYSGEKRITLRFLDTDGTWKDSWTGKLQ